MKGLASALTWALLQSALEGSRDVAAAPEHFRYQRAVTVRADNPAQACAVLDGTVYAHADARLNTMRLYAGGKSGGLHEVPFVLTESGEAGQQEEPARVMNLGLRGRTIVFDLAMPQRTYTAVVLDLDGKDFYATAKVSGSDGRRGRSTDLGSFALFDLHAQRLSRSTTLPLQEASFPVLHVELTVNAAPGGDRSTWGPSLVRGATVPPSREAQTVYTSVAETSQFSEQGRSTVAKLRVPAHVPVERAGFVLDPAFPHDFARGVTVAAVPDAADRGSATEVVQGEIQRVQRPGDAQGRGAIHSEALSLDAVLASSLRSDATVTVSLNNGDDKPLPLRAVKLQMRERKICFDAKPSTAYTLRYGDTGPLHAPLYDYARFFRGETRTADATLGPEQMNPEFRPRTDDRPYTERHPELLWVVLLAVVAVLGMIALRSAGRAGNR